MEQTLLAYDLKKTVSAIMMLYRNMEVNVLSLDRDIDCFDIVAGFLQDDTLTLYMSIICLEYVFRTLLI